MTLRTHTLPIRLFTALSSGGGGEEGVRPLVAVERSKRLLLLRGIKEEVLPLRDRQAGLTRAGYRMLTEIGRTAPHAVDDVLCYPAVGLWAVTTLRTLRAGETGTARPERMAALALAAAVRARTDMSATLLSEGGTVMFPSLGRLLLPGTPDRTPVTVRSREGHLELSAAGRWRCLTSGRRDWQEIRRLRIGSGPSRREIALDDLDLHRFPSAVRAHRRLSSAEMTDWRSRVDAGWDTLIRHHPQTAEEVRRTVVMLVPLASDTSASASARSSFGCVALSLPSSGLAAAVTLAHESQHVKLNALMTMFDLAHPVPDELYYAPWRPDPRPFTGLLHGAYAHLGVAGFWRRQRRHERESLTAAVHYARWRDSTLDAVRRLLAADRLTPVGQRFVEGMLKVLESWQRDRLPADALARARSLTDQHRIRWAGIHG
ncbi:HEXXH motif domain-containing protein [Streptosporangium sp. NPDC006007]|uniref:HEXXH motif domain-containing protein n=1 Tax=Streptosporangium sp. NPDC006007 TaxID=3154575 RepID=UPI0033AD20AB